MNVEEASVTATYLKGLDLTVLNLGDIALKLQDQFRNLTLDLNQNSNIIIKPEGIGGNHSHPRREIFIALTKGLVLVWQTAEGILEEIPLTPPDEDGIVYAYLISSGTTHAVKNIGTENAVLLEFADGPQVDVVQEIII